MRSGKQIKRCPHCNAKMVEYRHGLNVHLVKALKKLHEYGGVANLKNIGLTWNQWTNFQKLKYWGLVVKANNKDVTPKQGRWAITDIGKDFISGKIPMSHYVVTYRGSFVRFDGTPSYYWQIKDGYKDREGYVNDERPHEKSQGRLFKDEYELG